MDYDTRSSRQIIKASSEGVLAGPPAQGLKISETSKFSEASQKIIVPLANKTWVKIGDLWLNRFPLRLSSLIPTSPKQSLGSTSLIHQQLIKG
ncbi:hypothetical protein LINPERHAP2_LOCUS33547 [Linum perenne]